MNEDDQSIDAARFAALRKALSGALPKSEDVPAPVNHPPAKVIPFPLFPEETRPASNPLSRSSLFAAIQGKDRALLDNAELATVDGWKFLFSGRQLNQDDYDTLMQLVFIRLARKTLPFRAGMDSADGGAVLFNGGSAAARCTAE